MHVESILRSVSSPPPAQVAEQQGRYLARALSHQPSPASPEPPPFVFKPWGMLAYVGGYQALHDTPYDKSHGKHSTDSNYSGRNFGRISFHVLTNLYYVVYTTIPVSGTLFSSIIIMQSILIFARGRKGCSKSIELVVYTQAAV